MITLPAHRSVDSGKWFHSTDGLSLTHSLATQCPLNTEAQTEDHEGASTVALNFPASRTLSKYISFCFCLFSDVVSLCNPGVLEPTLWVRLALIHVPRCAAPQPGSKFFFLSKQLDKQLIRPVQPCSHTTHGSLRIYIVLGISREITNFRRYFLKKM